MVVGRCARTYGAGMACGVWATWFETERTSNELYVQLVSLDPLCISWSDSFQGHQKIKEGRGRGSP